MLAPSMGLQRPQACEVEASLLLVDAVHKTIDKKQKLGYSSFSFSLFRCDSEYSHFFVGGVA